MTATLDEITWSRKDIKAGDVLRGVTVSFLAEVFHLDPKTVRAKLATCPVLSRPQQGPRYDLAVAAPYLVTPIFDVKTAILDLARKDKLPAEVSDKFWSSMTRRQAWERNAGELWRTSEVMDVFSEVFLLIKSTMTLWVEEVDRAKGITAAQREVILELVDALQNEISEKLKSSEAGRDVEPSIVRKNDEEDGMEFV